MDRFPTGSGDKRFWEDANRHRFSRHWSSLFFSALMIAFVVGTMGAYIGMKNASANLTTESSPEMAQKVADDLVKFYKVSR